MSTDFSASSSNALPLTHHSPPPEVATGDDKKSDPPPSSLSPQPQLPSSPFSPSTPYAQPSTNAPLLVDHAHLSRSARALSTHPSCSGTDASVTTDTSAEAILERKHQKDLAAAAKAAKAVLTSRPTFLQAASKKLFPNVKQPVDLYHTYVNTYREDAVATSGDQGGSITLKHTLTSSKTVADLLLEAIQTGRAPSLPKGQDGANYSGVYTRPDAVDVGAQMKGSDLEQFRQGLNQLAQDPASVLRNSIDNYFEKPSTTTLIAGTGVSPQERLELVPVRAIPGRSRTAHGRWHAQSKKQAADRCDATPPSLPRSAHAVGDAHGL